MPITSGLESYPVVDIEVDIVDGSYHDVDSNDLSFQIAGSLTFKDAVAKVRPVPLEPIMEVECSTPLDYQGDVTGDLNRWRGRAREVAPRASDVVITPKCRWRRCSANRLPTSMMSF
jgi:elongation factor G